MPTVSIATEFLSPAAALPIMARVASCTTAVALTTCGIHQRRLTDSGGLGHVGVLLEIPHHLGNRAGFPAALFFRFVLGQRRFCRPGDGLVQSLQPSLGIHAPVHQGIARQDAGVGVRRILGKFLDDARLVSLPARP